MKKLILATGLLMATSVYAQTEVLTGVTQGKDYGVVYSLPKTQIELEIKVNKISYIRRPRRILGIEQHQG